MEQRHVAIFCSRLASQETLQYYDLNFIFRICGRDPLCEGRKSAGKLGDWFGRVKAASDIPESERPAI